MAQLNLRVTYFKHVGSGAVDITLTPVSVTGDAVATNDGRSFKYTFPSGDTNTPDASVDGETVSVTL